MIGFEGCGLQRVQFTRRGCKVILLGMTGEGVKAEFEVLNLANDSIQFLGSKMGAVRLPQDIPFLIDHYLNDRLKLDQLISGQFPLVEINQAIKEVKT